MIGNEIIHYKEEIYDEKSIVGNSYLERVFSLCLRPREDAGDYGQ